MVLLMFVSRCFRMKTIKWNKDDLRSGVIACELDMLMIVIST